MILNVGFFSWNPLPMEIRSSFELPSWPYGTDDGKLPDDVAEYFSKYSIFYYRDSITRSGYFRPGLIVPGSESVKLPVECYSHSCYIDDSEFKITSWWPQCSREFIADAIKLTGDRYAWASFNQQRIVKGFNNRFIKSTSATKRAGRVVKSGKDLV